MKYSVQAKENSINGGVGVEAGSFNRGAVVTITCDPKDKWNIAPEKQYSCNADGVNQYNHTQNGLTLAFGTMVGSIDDGNSFFPVGTLCKLTITADNTKLKLYCWDTTKGDDSGAIIANVHSS